MKKNKILVLLAIVFALAAGNMSVFALSDRQNQWFNLMDSEYLNKKGLFYTNIGGNGDWQIQCTQLPWHYSKYIFGVNGVSVINGNGNQMCNDGKFNTNYFTRIYNNPKDPNQCPQRGDIIMFNGPGSYGHVAIVADANPSGITVYEQNVDTVNGKWPSGQSYQKVRKNTLKYSSNGWVKAWLRPRPEKIIGGSAAPAPAPKPDPKPVNSGKERGATVTADTIPLRIRKGPGLNYAQIGLIPVKSRIVVLDPDGKQNNFYPVRYNGITGWASADWISVDPAPSPKPEPKPAAFDYGQKTDIGEGYDTFIRTNQPASVDVYITNKTGSSSAVAMDKLNDTSRELTVYNQIFTVKRISQYEFKFVSVLDGRALEVSDGDIIFAPESNSARQNFTTYSKNGGILIAQDGSKNVFDVGDKNWSKKNFSHIRDGEMQLYFGGAHANHNQLYHFERTNLYRDKIREKEEKAKSEQEEKNKLEEQRLQEEKNKIATRLDQLSNSEKANIIVESGLMRPAPGAGMKDPLTRVQAITFIIRLMGKESEANALSDAEVEATLSIVEDRQEIDDWAKKYVSYSIRAGISNGVGGAAPNRVKFAPKQLTTSNVFITMLIRSLNYNDVTLYNCMNKALISGMKSDDLSSIVENQTILREDVAAQIYNAIRHSNLASPDGLMPSNRALKTELVSKKVISEEFAASNF